MFRSFMSVSSNIITSLSSHIIDNGNDNDHNDHKNNEHDMKNNNKMNVNNEKVNIDNDIVVENVNDSDRQQLLLVGKVLSYDNLNIAPNRMDHHQQDYDPLLLSIKSESSCGGVTTPVLFQNNIDTNNNHDDYDDDVKSPSNSSSIATTISKEIEVEEINKECSSSISEKDYNDDNGDHLSFHPDEVSSTLLFDEFGSNDNSPKSSFGRMNMSHASDRLLSSLWHDDESRILSHQIFGEQASVLPETIEITTNNINMDDIVGMTTGHFSLMKEEGKDDDEQQQQNKEQIIISDHHEQASHENVKVEENVVEMDKKEEEEKDVGINPSHLGQQQQPKMDQWINPRALSKKKTIRNFFIIFVLIIIIVTFIPYYIDVYKKISNKYRTAAMMPSQSHNTVEEFTTTTSTTTTNASIFQSNIDIPVVMNNEVYINEARQHFVLVLDSKHPNFVMSTPSHIIMEDFAATSTTTAATTPNSTIVQFHIASAVIKNEKQTIEVTLVPSSPNKIESITIMNFVWIKSSWSDFMNFLWINAIQFIIYVSVGLFSMLLLTYKFINWHHFISSSYIGHKEQNNQSVNRVYHFHKYIDLIDFMKQSNTLLQRKGHTPKKSCTLQFVKHGLLYLNDLNVLSYNRLSKDELIILIQNFNSHDSNTMLSKRIMRNEAKAILQKKLIICYYGMLVTLSNHQLNDLIIVKLQNRNIDNNIGKTNIRKLSSIIVCSPNDTQPDFIISSLSPNTAVTNGGIFNNKSRNRSSRMSISIDHRNEMIRQLLEMGF